jgi:predicted GNAT family N-acyltransferase
MEVIVLPGMQLNNEFIAQSVDIITDGGQVATEGLSQNLARAHLVALALDEGQIVGVAAIKNQSRAYIKGVGDDAGYQPHARARELGYVAVKKERRGEHIGSDLADKLLIGYDGPCFATTRTQRMKDILKKRGFEKVGKEWFGVGNKPGLLSLWVRG